MPAGAKIEGGASADGDRHVIIWDRAGAGPTSSSTPTRPAAARGGPAPVPSSTCAPTGLRPRGWTSADAAGLSILAGLVRWDEVAAGRIDHAIRITAPRTRNMYVWPARHAASSRATRRCPRWAYGCA